MPEREGMGRIRLAEVFLGDDRLVEAMDQVERGMELRGADMHGERQGAAVKGRILLRMGRPQEAAGLLAPAHERAAKRRDWAELLDICSALAGAHVRLGHRRFAAHYYGAALGVIEQVAGALEAPAARRTFLYDVRRLRVYRSVADMAGAGSHDFSRDPAPLNTARALLERAAARPDAAEPARASAWQPMQGLVHVARQLSAELDVNKVLDLAAREILGLFEAERVFIVEVQGGDMNFRLARSFDGRTLSEPDAEISHAVVRQVVRTGQPLLVGDAAEDPRFADVSSVTELELHSVMAAPMAVRGDICGVVYADSRMFTGLFDQHRLSLMAMLANQVGIALRNAELFRELRRTRAELAQAERFEALGEVATFLAHEIKNPLSSIGLYLDMLRESYEDERVRCAVTQAVPEQLDRLRQAADRISQYAAPTDLLLVPVQIPPLLESAWRSVQAQAEALGVSLVTEFGPGLPPILADGQRLREVFVNLLKNALEALSESQERTIRVTARRAPRARVEVLIEDTGPGIPPEDISHIFEPFHTTRESGSGIGLAYCLKLVQEHAGTLEAENVPGAGSRFTINLPVAGA
jgi:signal transduction histidine kinase